MKNGERDENSPVEIIEGRLKRLHTNEIDARNRLRLREERKGVRAGKTKATWEGKSTNILKRKHQLKSLRRESKSFTRVGWILDYGLRLREEKSLGGWEKERQLQTTLFLFGRGNNVVEKELVIDLTKDKEG